MKFKIKNRKITVFTIILILISQLYIPPSNSETGSYESITEDLDVLQRSSNLRLDEWFQPVNIDNDPTPELVGLIQNGIGAGKYNPETKDFEVIWEIPDIFPRSQSWNLGDTNHDEEDELVIYTDNDSGTLTGYNPATGNKIWEQNLEDYEFRDNKVFGLEIADWDKDNQDEIIFGTFLPEEYQTGIIIMSNNQGSLETEQIIPLEIERSELHLIHSCDLDQDGNLELIIQDNGLLLIENSPSGYSQSRIDFHYVAHTTSGDTNEDGKPELITIAKTSTDYTLYIHEYKDNNLSEITHLETPDTPLGIGVSCTGDFDGDSKTEVAYLADFPDDPIDYYLTILSLSNQQLTTEYQKSYKNALSRDTPKHVEAVDMTNDGVPELVISGDYKTGILAYNPPATEPDTPGTPDQYEPTTGTPNLTIYPTEKEIVLEPKQTVNLALQIENNQGVETVTAEDVWVHLNSLDSNTVNTFGQRLMAGDIEPGSTWIPEQPVRLSTGLEGSTIIKISVMGSNFETVEHEIIMNIEQEEPEPQFTAEWMKLKTPYNMGSMQLTGLTRTNLAYYQQDWPNGDLFLKLYTSNAGNWMDVARYEFQQGRANLATSRKLGYFQTVNTVLSTVYKYLSFNQAVSQTPSKLKTLLSYESINEIASNKDTFLSLVNDLATIQDTLDSSSESSDWFNGVDGLIFKFIAAYTSGGFSLYAKISDTIFNTDIEDTSNRLLEKAFIHYACGLHAEEINTVLSKDNPTETDIEDLFYHAKRYYTLKKLESLLNYQEEKASWEHQTIYTIFTPSGAREEKMAQAETYYQNTQTAINKALERVEYWRETREEIK